MSESCASGMYCGVDFSLSGVGVVADTRLLGFLVGSTRPLQIDSLQSPTLNLIISWSRHVCAVRALSSALSMFSYR
jgi:hypothetical protein